MKHLFKLFVFSGLGCAFSVQAALTQTEVCRDALMSAETTRNTEIYDSCGFNDKETAFSEWAVWAEKEKAGQALYEICVRHPGFPQSERLCKKAVDLGNASALAHQGDIFYEQKDYMKAAKFYTEALSVTPSLLTNFEKGKIAQNMGLLYMNPDSNYYNPEKGMPLILKAVDQRGAEANNLMGVYSLFGMNGVERNSEESFKYLWRAALLGCPAAEENLGFFYLGHEKKIKNHELKDEMQKRMFSCVPPDVVETKTVQVPSDCNCTDALTWNKNYGSKPYRLVRVEGEGAYLVDRSGDEIFVEVKTVLPNGMKVLEIQPTFVAVADKNFNKMILKLSPDESCLEACIQKKNTPKRRIIPRYRFKFTQKECSDILYYAERLVDTSLPFTGKKECGFSADMDKASELLANF